MGVWVEVGRKRRVSLRKRLRDRKESNRALNSGGKPERMKMLQLKCLVLQNPAHMVHPQRCIFRLNIRFSSL